LTNYVQGRRARAFTGGSGRAPSLTRFQVKTAGMTGGYFNRIRAADWRLGNGASTKRRASAAPLRQQWLPATVKRESCPDDARFSQRHFGMGAASA